MYVSSNSGLIFRSGLGLGVFELATVTDEGEGELVFGLSSGIAAIVLPSCTAEF